MRLLGIDLETTSLDLAQAEIIEIGAVLWDLERQMPLRLMSRLVKSSSLISPEISAITGIQNGDLEEFGVTIGEALRELREMSQTAQFLVGHNIERFDLPIIQRYWIEDPANKIDLPCIDTMIDLPYPARIQTRKLSYLAAEHGFLNPFNHRAAFDVLCTFNIMKHYPIEEILRISLSPRVRIAAQVSYEQRDLAKSNGFRWDPEIRKWVLETKECFLENLKLPFNVANI